MSDLVERLRAVDVSWSEVGEDCAAAASEIDRLNAENTRLREVLKPLAEVFLYPDDLPYEHAEDIREDPDWDEDANDMQTEDVFILRRDIRRARAALAEEKKP